jgi:hypothetical protein
MLYQRKVKERVEAFEYTDPVSEELTEALKEREGLYSFRNNKYLIIHSIFKDKKAMPGDYIIFFPDGTIDTQSKDTFFAKFEPLENN